MRHCANIEDCKYPKVRDLLIGSKYFEGNTKGCKCVERTSVYSAEWDSERIEHFDLLGEGFLRAAGIFERLLTLDEFNPPDLKDKVKLIPEKYRKKLIEAIHGFEEVELPQSIVRILIYSGKTYHGFIDITPLGNIDNALLIPPLWMKSPQYWVTCMKQFTPEKILRPEIKETIECVPYVHAGVDDSIGVCAQYATRTALMNLLQKVPTVPELTKWVVQKAQQSQGNGWTAEQITEAMGEAIRKEGLIAVRLSNLKCPECNAPITNAKCTVCDAEMPLSLKPTKENIYAYIESGIPVVLGVRRTGDLPWWNDDSIEEGHALVGIGHTLSDKGDVNGFIVHDVSQYPYQVLQEPLENGKKIEDIIDEAIIPVYREIVINYPWAKELAMEMINLDLEDGLSYRPQLVEANKIKKWLAEGKQREHFLGYSIDKKVKKSFSKAYISRYVWLFEIRQELGNGVRNYAGDVIISAEEPRVLGFNNPLEGACGCIDEITEEIIIKEY